MEGLPGDVVLTIVRKLAVQDPLSLLRAACACKAVHRATEENPAIWKAAFHGSLGDGGTEIEHQTCEGLDGEIEALGGYRKMLAARSLAESHFLEQTRESLFSYPADVPNPENMIEVKETDTFLILVRLQGRLLLWGADENNSPEAPGFLTIGTRSQECRAGGNAGGFYHEMKYRLGHVQLQSVHSRDHFLQALQKERLSDHASGYSQMHDLKGLCGVASLEVFEFQRSQSGGGSQLVLLRILEGTLKVVDSRGWPDWVRRSLQLESALKPAYVRGPRAKRVVYQLSAALLLGNWPRREVPEFTDVNPMDQLPFAETASPVVPDVRFCCSACQEAWVFEELQLTLDVRGFLQSWRY